ncbi:FAD dependent oxidoreductase [Choanephora cucurbitarum]|nr:FAD dependent oxidoreductase [Choanephora cucurbitarum]
MSQHIVIVGGGVIGACSAYFLSKHEHIKVTLIEKTDIACGASGKSGGFLALDWSDSQPGMKELSRASYQLHQTLAKELKGAETYGYRAMNTYSIVFDPSLQDTNKKKKKSTPSEVSWVHQSRVRSFERMGSPDTTAQVTPYLFTNTVLEAAKKTGRVEVQTGTGVKQVSVDNADKPSVVLENGQTITADKVVIAMGPWSGQINLDIPVNGSHVHSIILKPDVTISNDAIFTAILDQGKTAEPEVYPRPDGTVYLCGAADNEPLPESAALVPIDAKAIDRLVHQATLVSPHLTEVELVKEQACYLPISESTGMPLIGPHPQHPHVFLATGHSCWGILNAPITGKIVSEWLVDGQVSCLDSKVMRHFAP